MTQEIRWRSQSSDRLLQHQSMHVTSTLAPPPNQSSHDCLQTRRMFQRVDLPNEYVQRMHDSPSIYVTNQRNITYMLV